MGALKRLLESLVPLRIYRALLSPYHAAWAVGSAFLAGFPAKRLTVIGITGTKGKSMTAEYLVAMLEEAGHTVALTGSIRTKIGPESKPKISKTAMPGRGFLQRFLRTALDRGATHAVIEITSEGAAQYRHWFLYLDALIVTNLAPEHIESHGSFEKYAAAKIAVARSLGRSPKRPRSLIVRRTIPFEKELLSVSVERKIIFSANELSTLARTEDGSTFVYGHEHFSLFQPGLMSAENALAALHAAQHVGVSLPVIARGLRQVVRIPGRLERVEEGQNFLAIVDYAHTPESLAALYESFPNRRKICVVSSTGGGRDVWKRPKLGEVAERYCSEIILTSEDSYDEDPREIAAMIAKGMHKKQPTIIIDRREAIQYALRSAKNGDAVFCTNMGSDLSLATTHGLIPWNEAAIVREELRKLVS